MPVLPNNFHGSTTFNHKITSYDLLAQRVRRMLGEPLIQIEISNEQMYEIIDTACEYFTKFAGATQEFLVFRSDLYIPGVGLPIGRLINTTPSLTASENPDLMQFPDIYKDVIPSNVNQYSITIGDGIRSSYDILHNLNNTNVVVQVFDATTNEMVFTEVVILSPTECRIVFNDPIAVNSYRIVVMTGYNASSFTSFVGNGADTSFTVNHNLSSQNVIVQVYDRYTNELVYPSISNVSLNQTVISFGDPVAADAFKVVIMGTLPTPASLATNSTYASTHSAGWDIDLNSYRRVLDVSSFEQGNNTGVNTLFTIEHTIAQQAYFGHLLGNVGYDLITWHTLKGWIETREKMLGLTPYLRFNPDSQMLRIIPEPASNNIYYGLVACKMQKAIKDIVSQLWVYRYTLALTKIAVGHTRGKYTGTNLFGGQSVNYSDLLSQGITERDKLEDEITKDLIDRDPIRFFIG
jgi:hypothetical protein